MLHKLLSMYIIYELFKRSLFKTSLFILISEISIYFKSLNPNHIKTSQVL